jgi:hypothetical protein
MRRLWIAALGACLLASPVLAQGRCQGSSGSGGSAAASSSGAATSSSGTTTSTASSSSTSASTGTSTSPVARRSQMAQLQNQIAQSEQLLVALQMGQASPPANSGVTTQQAQAMVSRRIAVLRNAVSQLAASNSSSATTRSAANTKRRR